MKKITLIIVVLISFQLLQAQQQKQSLDHPYIPLVVENAHWLVDYWYSDGAFSQGDTFDYKIEGDTIVSGTAYKKVYWRYISHTGIDGITSAFTIGPDILFGVIRENVAEKKIYSIVFIDEETGSHSNPYSGMMIATSGIEEEFLMYDFSLDVGESIDSEFIVGTVSSINDQFLYDETRIVQEFDQVNVIEGIGSNYGLFEPMMGFGFDWYLQDYAVGTDYECYPDMTGYASVNELETQISIIPNPATDYLEISTDTTKNIKEVCIYDATGRLLQKETQDFLKIDISNLNTNLLFIHVKIDTGINIQKILKN